MIETLTGQPLSGQFVYPGAAVDGAGNGTDWPGWKLENGEWVLENSDAFLRDGIRVVISVNPTAERTVSYPAANTACANPESTSADMAIVKTASVPQVGAGGGFSWILDVTNNGPDPAFGVVVGDIVPSSLQITGVTSAQFTCTTAGNTVTCTKPSMAIGEQGTVTIAVNVPVSAVNGTIQNVGTVESNLPDPNLTNNSDDASVVVVAVQAPTTTLPGRAAADREQLDDARPADRSNCGDPWRRGPARDKASSHRALTEFGYRGRSADRLRHPNHYFGLRLRARRLRRLRRSPT